MLIGLGIASVGILAARLPVWWWASRWAIGSWLLGNGRGRPRPCVLKQASHAISASALTGLGISCGGPLDAERGLLLTPPHVPGWHNVALIDAVRARLTVPIQSGGRINVCPAGGFNCARW